MKRLFPALIIAVLIAAVILSNVHPAIAEEPAAPGISPLLAERTILIQPGPDTDDTFLLSTGPTVNYGSSTSLAAGAYATETDRALLRFDLSKIPSDATITSASLTLRLRTDYSSNTRTYRVYRVTRNWVEDEATWNVYSTGNAWQTAGGGGASDRESSDIGSASIAHDASADSQVVFALDATKVRDWIDGDLANNGVMIKADTESGDLWHIYSSDIVTTTNYAPALSITFTSDTPYDAIGDEISSGVIAANDESGDVISVGIGELYALTISGGPFSLGGGQSLYDPVISTDGGSTWDTLWDSGDVAFVERINTYYTRIFFEATTASIYLRVSDCPGCYANNTGSFGWALNQALPSASIPVWQIGNYLIDGSVESWPFLNFPPYFPWSVSSMFDVTRQATWTYGGDTAPMCDSNFAMLRASLGHPSYIEQEFMFYGGDMFITMGLRTQGIAQVIIQIRDPFEDPSDGSSWSTVASFLTNGASNWKAFSYLLGDQWLGKYKLRVTAISMGAESFAAVDGVSVGEGWYQPCDYNDTVLTPPGAMPGYLIEKTVPSVSDETDNLVSNPDFDTTDGETSDWYTSSQAAFVPFLTATTGYMALFKPVIVAEGPVEAATARAIMTSKAWVEVRANSVMTGFDVNKARATASHLFAVSYIISDLQTRILSLENVETGAIIYPNDVIEQEQIPGTVLWRIKSRVADIPDGRYRIRVGMAWTDAPDVIYLDKVCIGGIDFIVAPECDLSDAELIRYQTDANFQNEQIAIAQATAISAATGTPEAATASALQTQMVGTQVVGAHATQTALVAAANGTQIALATSAQSSALTATPRAALTGTAFVQQFRATLTQIAGATQTRAAQIAINNATAVALNTQQAQLQQTAWANATQSGQLTAQANYQATLNAQATAEVVFQPTMNLVQTNAAATQVSAATALATNSNATTQYEATQAVDYQATINAIATQQAQAQLTTIALLTAAPNTNATLQAQATQIAQQYATLIATYQALATQQVLEIPILQPMPETAEITADVDCARPTNAINIPAWIDYEVCRILWFFTPNQYNMNQIDSAIDPLQNYEPFGTVAELNGMREDLLGEWQKYDWYTTGLEGSQDSFPVIADSDYATPPPGDVFTLMQRATEVPLLYGNIDWDDPALNYVFSTTCTLRIADLIGPYITPPICFLVDIFRTHGYLPIARLILDLGAILLFIGYANNTLRELLGEGKEVERVIQNQVRRSRG